MITPAIYCALCQKRCNVNPARYTPPSKHQEDTDEAYFHYKHGWLCTECITKVVWDSNDKQILAYDWNIEVKTP